MTRPSPEADSRSLARRVLEAVTGPWTWRNLGNWAGLILALMFIKGCIVDQYRIPSESMAPTLHGDPAFFGGDRVVVNKWIFGPRIPFTTVRLWNWSAPERWDIVVFHTVEPDSPHKTLIKRVAALPGEHVRLHFGELYINGEPIPFPDSMPEGMQYWNHADFLGRLILADASPEEIAAFQEAMPLRYGCLPEDAYSIVPAGHYLLLGDNTAMSHDGRVYGWVPRDHLYGRAFAIWFPWSRRRDFTGFSSTWWGMGLLYGLPLLIVAYELWRHFRLRRRETAA